LTAVCQRYIVGEDDVKDVLQESYVKIFMNIGTFQQREEGSVLSWMTRIVVNESLMFIRKKEHGAFIDICEDIPDFEEELEVEKFTPDDIHRAIMQLPTGYRTVLNLYVFEDKSHKEIAQILGIKESSSASQLNRAKKMIRNILDNQ
jgi:RNA polymerase sigma-70 factor (ECF subfamily)